MKLVDNWREGWKMFSIQAQALSVSALATWQLLPDDLKTSIPGWAITAFAFAMLALGIAGRLVQQDSVKK